ncbi:hypothetical protein HMPREF0083_06050 [Aneurinibacillus aneurinilyticus ATCC 12856]|uniref:Uncharacterized protein n=1 Tax=Aneurinibacillus aneurinilyticus ATCC 12856 TaxID=649747 RepID=U1XWT6_ANEAE|nr:hypothetical protein HMPREF0083_06050 [Aneurinibacillus aneurinilyticus ATCC 12856]
MVGEEKKEGRWLEKDTLALLLPERRAHPTSSFFRISSFQPPELLLIHQVISI